MRRCSEGERPYSASLGLSVTQETKAYIEQYAQREGLTVSSLLRRLVDRGLDDLARPRDPRAVLVDRIARAVAVALEDTVEPPTSRPTAGTGISVAAHTSTGR